MLWGIVQLIFCVLLGWGGWAWINRPDPYNGFFEPGVIARTGDGAGYLLIIVAGFGIVWNLATLFYVLAWRDREKNALGAARTQNQRTLAEGDGLEKICDRLMGRG